MTSPIEGTLAERITADTVVPVQAHRPQMRREATRIPDQVIEFYEGLGRQVRWGSRDDTQQAMDSTLGYSAVIGEDLPDDDWRALFAQSFTHEPNDTYTRGDMILQTRSHEDRDAQLEEERWKRDSMEDPGKAIEGLAEIENVHVDERASNLQPAGEVATLVSQDTLDALSEVVAERKAKDAAKVAKAARTAAEHAKIDDGMKAIVTRAAQKTGLGRKKSDKGK